MNILICEYATSTGMGGTFLLEGKAMLKSLAESFDADHHEIKYTTSATEIQVGTPVYCNEGNIKTILQTEAKKCDAALIIAPDDLLAGLVEEIEEYTSTMGSSPAVIRKCADKFKCGKILENKGIPAPQLVETVEELKKDTNYVVKPRYGCAAENTIITSNPSISQDMVVTEYIEGEHLSVSLVCADAPLALTINRQYIEITGRGDKTAIVYKGGITPYETPDRELIIDTAKRAAQALGCRGYTGVDIVMGDVPYVIDINPRPTTSLVGICKIIKPQIGELLIGALEENLPSTVHITGNYEFRKEDIL
ncbi:ATP-grasp domain-containing protein [Methanohalophilus sp.]